MAIVIGCDMHTRFQQLAVLDTDSGEIQEHRLENEPLTGVREFYRRYPAPVAVAIEATGHLRWFVELMAELGHELAVGDPAKLRAMVVRKQKTDRRDALHLAEVYRSGTFPRIWMPGPEEWESRHLLQHRQLVVRMRRQVKQALQAVAMGRGLRRRQALFTRSGRERLEALALPPLEAARRQQALALLAELEQRVLKLDQAVARRAQASPLARLLETHPGVGPVTALAWTAVIGDARRFETSNKLCSYCGLNPSEYTSGEGRQRLGHISKQGNRLLRYLLVEAAATAARLEPGLARFYRRKQHGKSRAVARVAVARKLAVRMYWMAKRGEGYPAMWGGRAHADLPEHSLACKPGQHS